MAVRSSKYDWQDVGDGTSDVHGEFWFVNLDPGMYEVREREQTASIKQSTSQPTRSPDSTDLIRTATSSTPGSNRPQSRDLQDGFTRSSAAASSCGKPVRPAGSWTSTATARSQQFEIDHAKAKGKLKVEVLATPAVDPDPAADEAQDLWFGNFVLGTITGFKFENINGNKDANGNPIFD